MDDAEKIAAGLTEAQRRAVLKARDELSDGTFWFAMGSARGIPPELKARSVCGHHLTPLGLAVRAILERPST